MGLRDIFVKVKVVFDRGKQWITYINFFMIVYLTASDLKGNTIFSAIPTETLTITIIFLATIVVCFLGYLEFVTFKTYQREAELLAMMNPIYVRILNNHKEILKRLKQLEDEHGKKEIRN